MAKVLSKGELEKYLEAEKQKIIEEYGGYTEETVKDFVENKAEKFHEEYFKEHGFN